MEAPRRRAARYASRSRAENRSTELDSETPRQSAGAFRFRRTAKGGQVTGTLLACLRRIRATNKSNRLNSDRSSLVSCRTFALDYRALLLHNS